jgi:hypothetical protein
MIRKHLAIGLSAFALCAIAIDPAKAAGSVVTLECGAPGQTPGTLLPLTMAPYGGSKDVIIHNLFDIDYGASTVREYFLNDSGANPVIYGVNADGSATPLPVDTASAVITDKIITWSFNVPAPPAKPLYVEDFSLSRVTGQMSVSDSRDKTPSYSLCIVWKPPSYTPKF